MRKKGKLDQAKQPGNGILIASSELFMRKKAKEGEADC
jgi:hypothetical protein